MPAALGVLTLVSRWEPRLSHEHVPLGRVPVCATLVCAAATPIALAGWVLLFTPNLHDITDAIPDASLLTLLLGAAAFALLNAFFEEWIWRGAIQSKLSALFPATTAIFCRPSRSAPRTRTASRAASWASHSQPLGAQCSVCSAYGPTGC